MKIEKQNTPETIMAELGQRIAHRRISLGITQAEIAAQAGVGKRTVVRIEAGEDTQVTTLIRLLRVLDLTEQLEQLVPEISTSPMEMLKHKSRRKKRATPKRTTKPAEPWKWGDEQ